MATAEDRLLRLLNNSTICPDDEELQGLVLDYFTNDDDMIQGSMMNNIN
jgi:hypothetical protein